MRKYNDTADSLEELDQDWDLARYALSFSADQQATEQQLARLERLYSFTVQGNRFLLPEGQQAELISQVQFTPMPNAPPHYLGLVNVRGNVVPLYGLAPFLPGNPPTGNTLLYALLLGNTANGALLAIDSKPSSVDKQDLQQDATVATTLLKLRSAIKSVYQYQGEAWHMLDCDALFTFLSNPVGH